MSNSSLAKVFLISIIVLIAQFSVGQKKLIDHTAYDEWNRVDAINLSNSGDWVTYEINPLVGDSELHIQKSDNSIDKIFQRGKGAKFSEDGSFCVFLIKPQHDTIRQLKLDKVKKTKFPKDSLTIYLTASDSIRKIKNVSSFKVPEKGNWFAYLSTKNLTPTLSKKALKKLKKQGKSAPKSSGKTLYVLNPITGKKKKIDNVKDYVFNRTGTLLAFTQSNKGDKDSLSLTVISLVDDSKHTLANQQFSIQKMKFDYAGDQLLFFSSKDTGKTKNYVLSYWKTGETVPEVLADSSTSGMPDGWTVSSHSKPYFSRDGNKIFFGTNEIQRAAPEDSLLAIEKAKVDVWSGTDLKIQPEQLKNLKRDKAKSYLSVIILENKKFIQLASEQIERVRPYNFGNADFAMGYDSKTYSRERNWAFPWKTNYHLYDLKSGTEKLLKAELLFGGSLSPSGKYFMYYNGLDSVWNSIETESLSEKEISAELNTNFSSRNNGMPFTAYPEGTSGWMMINGDEFFVCKDFYDIWCLHPTNPAKNFSLTNQDGQKSKMRYSIQNLEKDSLYLSTSSILIKGINDSTKDESVYTVSQDGREYNLTKHFESPHKFIYLKKAKDSDKLLIRRSSFTDYPDVEITSLNFKQQIKLSSANPQQTEYNWATVEFVDWEAYDSTKLRGLLYKPEDFDPKKSYPMIVYFYEDYQDNINFYYSPKPTASIIYPTEYCSNGYIVFIPDVVYEPGHPAKSAYNCIVSGTEFLVNKYDWIDSTRLALQGQSWGGYQTAQLVTMTDKYKAAMAGAPVSNMISAYGGIRWGSGLSRMFQYERTQSRIGHTIWERPDLYIENSPLFGIPNITTPLLIMHNDKDGAVPWYQGIEMFMGMRRLDKTVWMLNYNDDFHNLTRLANKRDLSIRMRQFFDHYLLDKPMPDWMKNGLPAIDKENNNGIQHEK